MFRNFVSTSCFCILILVANSLFSISEALVVHTDVYTTRSAVLLSPSANFQEPYCLELTYSAYAGSKVSFDFFLLFGDEQGSSKSLGGLPITADTELSVNLNQSSRDLQVKGLVDLPAGAYRIIVRLGGDELRNIAIHRIQLSQGRCREPGKIVICILDYSRLFWYRLSDILLFHNIDMWK